MIFGNGPLKFPIPIVLYMTVTGCRKCLFGGECLKISEKLHGGDRKHTEVRKKKSKNQHNLYLRPQRTVSNPLILCPIQ